MRLRCCSVVVVLGCTTLYQEHTVVCQAAPRCAGMHHTVL